jgi:hypothetical protein
MGGEVTVKSKIGKGTSFLIKFSTKSIPIDCQMSPKTLKIHDGLIDPINGKLGLPIMVRRLGEEQIESAIDLSSKVEEEESPCTSAYQSTHASTSIRKLREMDELLSNDFVLSLDRKYFLNFLD